MNETYKAWLSELKQKVRSAQLKAAVAVNAELIALYWDLGKTITQKQTAWGTGFVEQLSKDLMSEFPDMKGFSVTNLKYCRLLYNYTKNSPQPEDNLPQTIRPQAEDELLLKRFKQIPWGHIKLIITKIKIPQEALFYAQKTIENGWSRNILELQLKSNLYHRQGNAITNFQTTLPPLLSDLAAQTLKDPYTFDFISIAEPYKEKDIEKQLVKHITKFLLELGKGFAFVGQQFHLEVAGNDYYLDLLFYHIRLKCYVVVELKNTRFIPEYTGKLNFYLSAVDSLLKDETDKPTIGLLLCKEKNNIEAEFALRDLNKPIGVSEFTLTEILPEELKSSLPSIEEIENELKDEF